MPKIIRWASIGLASIVIAIVVIFVVLARLSLPAEDGVRAAPGLASRARIDFDALGIPHIRAESRTDALVALGYVTGRDRLFQMDMFRRKTAGRLAEIFGVNVAKVDRWSRVMGFDRLSRRIFAQLPEEQRAALIAYSAGVNQALREATILPMEFVFLSYRPEPWRPEDCVLVLLGLAAGHSYGGFQEHMATVMQRALPPKVFAFLTPESDCYNESLAPRDPARCAADTVPVEDIEKLLGEAAESRVTGLVGSPETPFGSNAWVVGRDKTRDGRAIVANDMHVALTAPNIWYRVELDYRSAKLTGLTAPGLPMVVTGSNGDVAWGFTSVEGDFSDFVRIEKDPGDPAKYRTAQGSLPFTTRTDTIAIRGEPSETLQIRETIWGPVLPDPLLGDDVAVRWTILDPSATNFDIMNMDRVTTVRSALPLLRNAGGPPLNVLLADRAGGIAWTLMGKLPKRYGHTGLHSESWADGKTGWLGYYSPDELPSRLDPPSGFLVNTNQRMLGAAEFAPTIGHDFSGGFRAWRVTQRLRELSGVTEEDMLALQLDTNSEFYRYYQTLALRALDAPEGKDVDTDDRLRRYLEAWDGRAEANSLGLPLIVEFRQALVDAVLSPIVARCRKLDSTFVYQWAGVDGPVQRIVESGRSELLPDRKTYHEWTGFLRSLLLKSARRLAETHGKNSVSELSWGDVNRVRIAHPLGGGAPLIGGLLDMPASPLAGCKQCVRYAYRNSAASARMVVSPGHEADGIMQMPSGQSGQPVSAHYSDQEADWVAGRSRPFLTGEKRHSIVLEPSS